MTKHYNTPLDKNHNKYIQKFGVLKKDTTFATLL